MPKTTSSFVCQACGAVAPKWAGRCESCGEWNSIVEEIAADVTPKGLTAKKGKAIEFVSLDGAVDNTVRLSTGMAELNRVLGGGLVPGSAILIGGDPGIGKSTLLLQTVAQLAAQNIRTAYISGEESVAQTQLRAGRLGLSQHQVRLAAATSVRDIIASLTGKDGPQTVVIDSIQTMFLDNLDSAPGTVSQVRASAHELIKHAKRHGQALFIVGHVTKDGQIAGPRVLEHMVDTVLYFEGERGYPFRILRTVKNRFGGTDEIGVFEMGEAGLQEVANPSALFLTGRNLEASGSVVFAGIEGTRPVLMEIQALVAPSGMATPRRAVVGWDAARLAMILAVLDARCGIRCADKEVYLNVAGGLRISEPAADLAVAAALLSALADTPINPEMVVFGEVGLSGEVRQVNRAEARLKESEKLGFTHAIAAPSPSGKATGLKLNTINHLRELVEMLYTPD